MQVFYTVIFVCFACTFLQAIDMESKGPFIQSSCTDMVVESQSVHCGEGFVALRVAATSSCTSKTDLRFLYAIDLNDDGSVDLRGQSADASAIYPVGKHTINWTVIDACGDKSLCSYQFEIRDGRAPKAHCINGLMVEIATENLQAVVSARDINQGSYDNCAIESYRIEKWTATMETHPPLSEQVTFEAKDLGTQSVNLWVKDVQGNWTSCNTYVVVMPGKVDIKEYNRNLKASSPGIVTPTTAHEDAVNNLSILSIQPNPVQESAQISFFSPKPTPLNISVRNIYGEIVYQKALETAAGQQRFELGKSWTNGPGVYYLHLHSENQSVIRPFLVISH